MPRKVLPIKREKKLSSFLRPKRGGKNKEYLVQPVARLFQFYGRITIRLYQCRSSNWRDQHRERKGALLSIAWLMVYPGSAAVQWCLDRYEPSSSSTKELHAVPIARISAKKHCGLVVLG